jgi:hypothetical protein
MQYLVVRLVRPESGAQLRCRTGGTVPRITGGRRQPVTQLMADVHALIPKQ